MIVILTHIEVSNRNSAQEFGVMMKGERWDSDQIVIGRLGLSPVTEMYYW